MDPSELQPSELLHLVANFFESSDIHYRVVGSMASMAYGEPRFTNDVDIVAELTIENIPSLVAAFPAPDYDLSEQAAKDAVGTNCQFNIIHPASGLKVDVIIPPESEFALSERARVRRITSQGEYSAWFASPEDVILNKLLYFQLGGGESQKHLRDIGGIVKLMGETLDHAYIIHWADHLGVTKEWQATLKRLAEPDQ